MITVFNNIAEFDALQTRWTELYEESGTATPYQSFYLNRLNWKYWSAPSDQLYLLCYAQHAEKAYDAIFPCYLNKRGELHFLEYHSDFCDALIGNSQYDRYKFYYEVMNYLKSDSRVKSICFNNMKGNSRVLSFFCGFGSYVNIRGYKGYSEVKMHPQPSDRDFIASLDNLYTGHKNELRNLYKKAADVSYSHYQIHDASYPENDIEFLLNAMISKGIRSKEYWNDSLKSYLKELYESGIVTVGMNYKEGSPISCVFLLRQRTEQITWIVLYTEKAYNILLNLFVLEEQYRKGETTLNLARGLHAYKKNTFHPYIHNLYSMAIYRSKKDAQLAFLKSLMSRIYRKAKRLLIIV